MSVSITRRAGVGLVILASAQIARAPQLRTMRQFAEQEIILPSGPHEGRRYDCERQPFSKLWFEAVESGYFRRIMTTGPSQSGKTLMGFVIPLMYHLFEVGETVICGLPSLDMAADKWGEDILPAIAASRYREMLPKAGPGSRGGVSNMSRIQFSNGTTLRFMTGQGNDKSRAGFTSRVVVLTELDGMDQAAASSREADPIRQIEARTRAYGDQSRIYGECTVSLESGRTWREYKGGSESRIAIRCAHCGKMVTPEREHLQGWQGAADVLEAGERAAFACPGCGHAWSEADRQTANRNGILVHRGQEITPVGAVAGPMPRTDTLGFRWTATNNLLVNTNVIGQEEWRASRATSEEAGEKEMRQWWWAIPHKPDELDLTGLDANVITKRTSDEPRGFVPAGVKLITVGVDVGKHLCHWLAIAWREHATPHILDYGRLEVPSTDMAEERAILLALRNFRDTVVKEGWESSGGRMHPKLVMVDSGYMTEPVYAFAKESRGMGFFASKGLGTTQRKPEKYRQRGRNECVLHGDGYQGIQLPDGLVLLELNADQWKGWVHARLQTPLGQPGAMTLFRVDQPVQHLTLAKHFTAEKKEEVFVTGTGLVTRYRMVSRNNHFLDAAAIAAAGGYAVGERLTPPAAPAPVPAAPPPQQRREERSNWASDFTAGKPANWMG